MLDSYRSFLLLKKSLLGDYVTISLPFFTLSGDVGSFQILVITNNVAVSILSATKNVWVYLEVEGLGHWVCLCSALVESASFPKSGTILHPHQQHPSGSSPTFLPPKCFLSRKLTQPGTVYFQRECLSSGWSEFLLHAAQSFLAKALYRGKSGGIALKGIFPLKASHFLTCGSPTATRAGDSCLLREWHVGSLLVITPATPCAGLPHFFPRRLLTLLVVVLLWGSPTPVCPSYTCSINCHLYLSVELLRSSG